MSDNPQIKIETKRVGIDPAELQELLDRNPGLTQADAIRTILDARVSIDLALQLAGLGWYVFPCKPDKKPYTAQGFKDATTDPAIIQGWWSRWPGALIGIACEKSGIFAVDVDNKNGIDGTAEWSKMVENCGAGQAVLVGPVQTTPSGGTHLIFKLPENVKIPNNAGKLAPGLDLRSKGYICTGGAYAWQPGHGPETPLTDAPAWLLDKIGEMTKPKAKTAPTMPAVNNNGHKPGNPGRHHLEKALSKGTIGTGDQGGFDLACQLRDDGLSNAEMEVLLNEYADKVTQDKNRPFTAQDAKRWLNSALTKSARDPAKNPNLSYTNIASQNAPAGVSPEPPPAWGDDLPEAPPEGQASSGDPWQIRTLKEAYQPRPAVEYIAGQMFALPSLNIVYGAPGTLKSFILADLALCAAAGEEWLPMAPWQGGGMGYKTRQMPTLWLDFDNGQRRTDDRFSALGKARNIPEDAPLYYVSMPNPWLDATNKGSIGALAIRAKERGVQLICIDNLGTVSGNADENSGEMVQVMSLFRQLSEETGAAVVLIHHQRKSNGLTGRAGDSLRGHSSIEAALDLALLVEREEYSDTVTIRATKVRGADVLPFGAAFTYEDDSSGDLVTAKFWGINTEDTSSGAAIEREITAALYGTVLNKTDLVKAVKEALPEIGVNRIRDRIERLVAGQKLKVTTGAKNERLFSRI